MITSRLLFNPNLMTVPQRMTQCGQQTSLFVLPRVAALNESFSAFHYPVSLFGVLRMDGLPVFANKIQCHCVPLLLTGLLNPELGHFQDSREWLKRVGKKASQSSGLLTKLA